MKKIIILTFLTLFCLSSLSFGGEKVTKSVTAENTFTDPITPKFAYGTSTTDRYIPTGIKRQNDYGYLNFAVYGFGTATVTVQVAYDYGTAWIDVSTFTSNTVERIWEFEEGAKYRAGVKTGDYTSGTIQIRLSR